MREILFRGKRLDNGEWVEGSALIPHPSFGGETVIITQDAPFHSLVYTVDPETVGQFIGLTDKNGKKIFEGDILKRWDTYSVVEYGAFNCSCCDGVFGWYLNDDDIRSLDGFANAFEVAGNIHDNPELLGGTDHE